MTEPPLLIKHQIHTVLLTRGKRQGCALGNDENGHAIKIMLLTPRAVELGIEKLQSVAHACGGPLTKLQINKIQAERVQRLDISSRSMRKWSLQ